MTKLNKLEDFYLTLKGILHYQNFLKDSCYLSSTELKKYQFEKLKLLLEESSENVPYYHDTFNSIGFNPKKDFNKLEDIEKVPILTKQKARDVRPYLNNRKYERKAFPMRTSGSTGQPFEVLVSKNAWIVEQAVVWRHWKWSGYNFRDPLAMVRSYVPKDGRLYKTDKIRNFTYFSPFHLNDEMIAHYLDVMFEKKITVLRGYPSSILAIANYVKRSNHPIPNFKLILVASERLSSADRNTIEKALKCSVTNHYGLAEICVMMGDCEKHEGLHNYDEYGYLELLDLEGSPHKKVVGTNLHNLATPLIRSETGDLAEIAEKKCSCKRSLPTIKNIIGRSDSYIVTPKGYKIPTVNFYTMFEKFQEIDRWQIIQETENKITFNIHAKEFPQNRIEELNKEIKRRINDDSNTTIVLNKPLIQKYEGKIPPFISRIK
jgi:phenylacetate-CoA ligase